MAVRVRCPTCGAAVAWIEASQFRPFCSERCRTIDLGAWAAERHRISDDPVEGSAPTGAEPHQDPADRD